MALDCISAQRIGFYRDTLSNTNKFLVQNPLHCLSSLNNSEPVLGELSRILSIWHNPKMTGHCQRRLCMGGPRSFSQAPSANIHQLTCPWGLPLNILHSLCREDASLFIFTESISATTSTKSVNALYKDYLSICDGR